MKSGVFLTALFIATSGTAANAGIWSEFVDRCLTPYLAGEDPDISGLEPVPAAIMTGDTIDTVQTPDGSLVMVSMDPGPYAKFSCWLLNSQIALPSLTTATALFVPAISIHVLRRYVESDPAKHTFLRARSATYNLGRRVDAFDTGSTRRVASEVNRVGLNAISVVELAKAIFRRVT